MGQDARVFLEEADKLETLLRELKSIRDRTDAQRGKALVDLRRALSGQVSHIASTARPIMDRSEDVTSQSEFRRLLSTLMSNIALHQASWPAVLLLREAENVGYAESAQQVDHAAADMVQWLRDHAGSA